MERSLKGAYVYQGRGRASRRSTTTCTRVAAKLGKHRLRYMRRRHPPRSLIEGALQKRDGVHSGSRKVITTIGQEAIAFPPLNTRDIHMLKINNRWFEHVEVEHLYDLIIITFYINL